ncbi:hypothetical protein B0J11DRAFT_167752 [Dendryphion nanum]|uniref:RING-type domain-containing protein n=1 Tax=Dendryphion nanum TaxID=256645 RepID=A0A9P9IXD2_9PLEO|nr:hypothetical protein B0J11DRAFT_167752 [Dendryphion nanum]
MLSSRRRPLPYAPTTLGSLLSSDEIDVCSICLEPFRLPFNPIAHGTLTQSTHHSTLPSEPRYLDVPVTLKMCGHIFGRRCLDQWLQEATTCPVCRIEVNKKDHEPERLRHFSGNLISSLYSPSSHIISLDSDHEEAGSEHVSNHEDRDGVLISNDVFDGIRVYVCDVSERVREERANSDRRQIRRNGMFISQQRGEDGNSEIETRSRNLRGQAHAFCNGVRRCLSASVNG